VAELYTRTNQKVFFAGLALQAWRSALASSQLNAAALVQAEREACLFHLYGGLLGLCHEVAGFYRLSERDAAQVEAFLRPQLLEAAPGPELGELIELAQTPQSWLAQLLNAYRELFLPPRQQKPAKVDPTLPLIGAVNLDATPEPLQPEQLEEWRQALKELALRFRENLSEW
jgi:hypothetical protein